MATIFKRPGSPYWQTAFFDANGERRFRSTTKTSRGEAVTAAAQMEAQSRRTTAADQPVTRRILAALEDAADRAIRGGLTESVGREILNRIMEASTGSRLQDPSIEEWMTGWLQDKKRTRSGRTAETYEGLIRSFLKSLAPAKRAAALGALSVAEIRNFRDRLLDEGRSEGTANHALKILRAPLNAARRQGLINHNPAEAIDLLPTSPAERDIFSPQQITKIVGAGEGDWQGLVLAGYYTGARLGDLSRLLWKSIDLNRQSISFVQRKTKRAVEIPIHPELDRWLTKRQSKATKDAAVFPSLATIEIRGRNGLSQQFARLMEKAGVQGAVINRKGKKGRDRSSLSFHSLRHSFNSAMANAGVSQELRQRLTGHASKAVNDRYTHTELATLRGAVSLVPSLSRDSQSEDK